MHAWGADRPRASASRRSSYRPWAALAGEEPYAGRARGRCRSTWRWRRAPAARTSCTATPGTRTSPGTWRGLVHGIPHVATVHSLEPLRPWKAEQLGGGYALSSFGRDGPRLEGADAHHRRVGADAPRHPALLPGDRPDAGHGDPQRDRHRASTAPTRRPTCSSASGIDPERPVGRVRRADHAAEGPRPPARRGRAARPRRAGRALRRRPRHARDRRRDRRAGRRAPSATRGGVVWIERMLPRARA